MGLIIPKCNAHPKTLELALKIYYEADTWVTNAELIEQLSNDLIREGIENQQKEPQSYTKKTQVLSYYGLLEWEDPSNTQSMRRITKQGKILYDTLIEDDKKTRQELLLDILSSRTFGRNVLGCDSDSDLEAPNIFLKSCMLVKELTNKEFAYILGRMEFFNMELADALFEILIFRKRGELVQPDARSAKWADPKPILALADWGLLRTEMRGNSKYYALDENILTFFFDKLSKLKIRNTDVSHMEGKDVKELSNPTVTIPLQTIYYGAPGTGKSHKIKTLHKENVVRTTFHPDSDYSTFVGAYKPTMEEVERYESSGTPIREKRIVYNYVPQAFLRAYTSAWKNYPEPQYLVIEEINRGNCAQIFGDLFQLLDRHETGFSDYPICTDSDIQRYLSEEFSKCDFTEIIGEETEAIQEMYAQECSDILNQLQLGNLLLLPKNLYILATMNTSDQSLFPIDSAFKRRWHWEYTPIRNGGKEWTIEANGQHWDWWAFLQAINERIEEATSSEDKKLGYFFVKAGDKGASIKASLFVGKVIFYLWNDVYKDYGFDDSIFQDSNGKQMTFPRFYETNEANEEVNEVLVANFLRNVVGKSIEESHNDEINENKEQ